MAGPSKAQVAVLVAMQNHKLAETTKGKWFLLSAEASPQGVKPSSVDKLLSLSFVAFEPVPKKMQNDYARLLKLTKEGKAFVRKALKAACKAK
jgi:hypothetical protein